MTDVAVPGAAGTAAAMVYDPMLQAVYLARAASVQVIDTSKKAVEASAQPGGDLLAYDQRYLYVATSGQPRVSVIAKDGWATAGNFSLSAGVAGLWDDAVHDKLYVAAQTGDVQVFSGGATPQPSASYRLPGSFQAGTLAGDTLYAATAGQLSAVDLSSGTIRSAPLQGTAAAIAYDDQTPALWLTTAQRQLLLIDPHTLQTRDTLPAPSSRDIAFDPGERWIYTFGGAGFGSFDTNTDRQWAQVQVSGAQASTGTVDPINHEVYVYEAGAQKVAVYAWGASDMAPAGTGGGGGTAPLGTGGSGGGPAAATSGLANSGGSLSASNGLSGVGGTTGANGATGAATTGSGGTSTTSGPGGSNGGAGATGAATIGSTPGSSSVGGTAGSGAGSMGGSTGSIGATGTTGTTGAGSSVGTSGTSGTTGAGTIGAGTTGAGSTGAGPTSAGLTGAGSNGSGAGSTPGGTTSGTNAGAPGGAGSGTSTSGPGAGTSASAA